MSEPLDSKNAQEIAYLEKPARDREIELKRVAETGLTEDQHNSVAIMDGLEEKYPKAFETQIDSKGRKALMIAVEDKGQKNFLAASKLVVSQEGVVGIGGLDQDLTPEDINLTGFIDMIAEKREIFPKYNGFAAFDRNPVLTASGLNKVTTSAMSVRKFDLMDPAIQKSFKSVFEDGQNRSITRDLNQERIQEKSDPKAILSNL